MHRPTADRRATSAVLVLALLGATIATGGAPPLSPDGGAASTSNLSLATSSPLGAGPLRVPVRSPSGEGIVYQCEISGPLSESTVALVRRTFDLADEAEASHVVLVIDTPGGEITLMHRIIEVVEDADAITVALVDSKAASAGALISIACDYLFMTPGSNIGSALPIMMPMFIPIPFMVDEEEQDREAEKERKAETEKIISDMRATFRAKAQAKNRNEFIAMAMVDPLVVLFLIEIDDVPRVVSEPQYRSLVEQHGENKVRRVQTVCESGEILNLTAEEAEGFGFIDAQVGDRAGAFEILDITGAETIEIETSWSENLAAWIHEHRMLIGLVAAIAVGLELYIPGFGVPGILAVCLFSLIMFGNYLVGLADLTEILLILAGLALVAVELFVMPGMLVPGAIGVLAILGGVVLSFQTFDLPTSAPGWARDEWWRNVKVLGLSAACGTMGLFFMGTLLPRIPVLNRVMLKRTVPKEVRASAAIPDDVYRGWAPAPGAIGEAVSALRPAGKIAIEGRQLDAVAEGEFVEEGREIKVVLVEGNRIVVRST